MQRVKINELTKAIINYFLNKHGLVPPLNVIQRLNLFVEEQKARQKERWAKYYLKNKENYREYYLKNKEKIREGQRAYYLKNKDKLTQS